MNEEEAKKHLLYILQSLKRENFEYYGEVSYEKTHSELAIETVLNLIKKQQTEIETLKRDFEIVDHECSRLEQEDIKKDMIINLMAEQLTTPVHSKEWVINYYKKEIEKGKEE